MRFPSKPPNILDLFQSLQDEPERMVRILAEGVQARVASADRYDHWDELRRKSPPEGLTVEEWWLLQKMRRGLTTKKLPLLDKEGVPFSITQPDAVLEKLPEIDSGSRGAIVLSEEVTNPGSRDRYLVTSLIEEAVTSSQLEGAATTRRVAREMIRSGRRPRGRDERMIFNNYDAMEELRTLVDRRLSPSTILDLHSTITEGTLEEYPDGAGRLRRSDEPIAVVRDDTVLHVPPSAEELEERMELLCAFANGEEPGYFIHPVVRSILVHFWLAYDHPFVDGNGRTARALFYWSMLRQGYWLCQHVSISTILKRAPAKYARSFLYVETDDNDTTYFVIYQLSVLQRALKALEEYLRSKMRETRSVETLLRGFTELNHRQIALLGHAIRHPEQRYTIESHRRSHAVVYQTARTDLLSLADQGLLEDHKVGRRWVFSVPADLVARLEGERDSKA